MFLHFRQNVKLCRFKVSLYKIAFSFLANNFVMAHSFGVFKYAFCTSVVISLCKNF